MKKDLIGSADGNQKYMRMFITQGFPINVNGIRYKNLADRKSDQQQFSRDFQFAVLDDLEEKYADGGLKVTMFSQDIMEKQINKQVE